MQLTFSIARCLTAMTTLLLVSAQVPLAHAAIFAVGAGAGCTHSTINAAVLAAEFNPGPDTIRITQSLTWTAQAVIINTAQNLDLVGGYQFCQSTVPVATPTSLSGAGGNARPVVTVRGAGIVKLRALSITGGDQAGSDPGGGVFFEGSGILDIADTSISNNIAGFGGGIYANGTGPAAELIIGAGTGIVNNTARLNGGGIHVTDIETTIREDNISILLNQATGTNGSGGYGGGIQVRACVRNSFVYLGSPGVGGLAVVSQNSARFGGGVAIEGGCSNDMRAELRAFSTVAGRYTRIQGNTASIAGGGVYMNPYVNPILLASTGTRAYFWNASIEDNSAPQASALYLGSDSYITSTAYFNDDEAMFAIPPGSIGCPHGTVCGRISGNVSASNGPVISGENDNSLVLQRMVLSGNSGSELINLAHPNIHDSVLVGNQTTNRLIQSLNIDINDSTITDNVVGGTYVIGASSVLQFSTPRITSSIIWQPGKSALSYSGSAGPDIHDILANETGTLANAGGTRLLNANPRFVDTGVSDYSLTAASPAVDFAAEVPGVDIDLVRHVRDIDLDIVANRHGPRDLGALEREFVQPLVQNSDFNVNLDTWKVVTTAAVSSWDATQNASGPAGSGSLKVALTTTAPAVSARKQCIHLPAAGDYTLNGWGKSTGSMFSPGDNVQLYWEFRANGDEACTSLPSRNGTLTLSSTSTWRRPVNGTRINVSPQEWTTNSSLLVFLVVDEGGGIGMPGEAPTGSSLDGWFDGVTLDVTADNIFANGFDG